MIKHALRTYWNAMHPRNLKKINKQGSFFWLIYMIVIYPAMLDSVHIGDESYTSMYLLTVPMTPFLWFLYSEMMVPFMISKAVYLCPMQKEERRKYMKTLLFVRMAIPVFLAIIFETLWAFIDYSGILEAVCMIFLYCSMEIGISIKSELRNQNGKRVDYAFHDTNGMVKQSYINIANSILAAILVVLVVAIGKFDDIGLGLLVGGGMVLVCCFDIIILVRQYQDCIENACDYELYFS